MGFVLGFGSVEERERQKIREAIESGMEAGVSIAMTLKPWNDAYDRYKAMDKNEAPERYTGVHCYGGNIHFSHINRRHALSPDGWALWQVEEPLRVTQAAWDGLAKLQLEPTP